MDLLSITLNKVGDAKTILEFSEMHKRAVLCFSRHGFLNLPKASLILDAHPKKVEKVLEDLVRLKVLKKTEQGYEMMNVYDSLNALTSKTLI